MGLPSGCMSDYLEAQQLNHIFRSSSFTKPTTLAICLSSGIPDDTMTGSNFMEFQNAGGYARQTLNPSDSNWTLDNNVIYNLVEIDFPVSTQNQGFCSGIVICDNSTYGAGNVLYYGKASPGQFVYVGNQFVVPVSGISARQD